MRRLSARERGVVAVGIGVVAIFLVGFLVVRPMRRRAATLSRQAATFAARLTEARHMYEQIPAVRQVVTKLQTEVAQQFRPRQAEVVPDVVREIVELNRDLGLRLTSVRPSEPEALGQCLKYPINFRVEASFPQLARLLYEIEQPPRQLWVEGVEIGPGGRGGQELSASVHVATYTLKPPGEAGHGEG
jgi:Tfp pilus assembly protein PilO